MRCFSVEKKTVKSLFFVLAVFSFFGVLANILTPNISIHATTQTASQTVGPNSISISSDDSIAINITPTSEQAIYTGTNTLNVTNSCPSGATITLTTGSNEDTSLTNKLVRSGTDSSTKEINPTTGSSLVNNSWGYSIDGGSTYHAVPAKDQVPATIYNSSSATNSAEAVNIKYGIKMNSDLPSGNYSNDVIYTVAVKPACLGYTVNWDFDGGTAKAGATYPTNLTWGSTIDLSELTPTKEGYAFAGWTYNSSTFTGNETNVNVNENNARTVTLKAKWCNACITWNPSVNETKGFSYTGGKQGIVMQKAGTYKVELWGASGGYSGGSGAYTSGNITLKDNSMFYIYVGGAGAECTVNNSRDTSFNGGGLCTSDQYDYRHWGSGGGGTDIRLIDGTFYDFASLKTRIMVAAGGGGDFASTVEGGRSEGGSGGGLIGYDAQNTNTTFGSGYGLALGGTQTQGGQCSSSVTQQWCRPGTFGVGGNVAVSGAAHSGGGGGYYGGAQSGHVDAAAGGSSFISGHSGCNAIASGSTASNITHTGNSAHYSGYTFTNTIMIDGAGYKWTNTKGSLQAMPNPSGGNYTSGAGRTGNGYARFTYLGN